MYLVIKNANVTTGKGSYKADVAIKDEKVVVGRTNEDDGVKVIDASKIVLETIVNWFGN